MLPLMIQMKIVFDKVMTLILEQQRQQMPTLQFDLSFKRFHSVMFIIISKRKKKVRGPSWS